MRAAVGTLLVCLVSAACSPARPAVVVPVVPAPTPADRLAAADRDFRAACLDCLVAAFTAYSDLRNQPTVARAAAAGAVKAAGLIAMRELGLGMLDSGYLDRARELIAEDDGLAIAYGIPLDVIAARSPRVGRVVGSADTSLDRGRIFSQNRLRWTEWLRGEADGDEFLAAFWISLGCATLPTASASRQQVLLAPLTRYRDVPAVQYELASCANPDPEALQALAAGDPRFREVEYWLGFRDMRDGNLDAAEVAIARAYEWRDAWPAAASALGGLSMTAEDFEGALTRYERALALMPGMADALIGRIRALSYLGRADEAIGAADALVDALPGDAYFWRAWNKNQLHELDEAWADVQRAEALWVSSEVAKLAGVIAYGRGELPVARDRFQTATRLRPEDCESQFYLGGVHAELREWGPSADVYLLASRCMEAERATLETQIAALQASNGEPVRVARQIANRRLSLDVNDRRARQALFNLAAASYNLGRYADARGFADQLTSDEEYGERARSLIVNATRER
jgi:tetratricopeptide (TPR) repeat protein